LSSQVWYGHEYTIARKRSAVIRCLVDGCSIRATTRITGVAKNTIQKLTRELGEAVLAYHDTVVPDVKAGIADHKWSIEEMVDLLPEAPHPHHGERASH
jgi:transposase